MPELSIGVTLPTLDPDQAAASRPGIIPHAVRRVEDLGFESAWIADLVVGDGTPFLDAPLTLAAAAAVTDRIGLGFGVLVLPLRPVAWTAAQVTTLQHLSGGRLLLGVGSGGFPAAPFWSAVGADAAERGQRTDEALAVLPGLVAGETVRLRTEDPPLTLAPEVVPPPILIGGASRIAIRRAGRYGDGWFPSLVPPDRVRAGAVEVAAVSASHGRPTPGITVGTHAVLGSDPSAQDARSALERSLVSVHGIRSEDVGSVLVTGEPRQAAEQMAAWAEAGAERIVVSLDGDDWTHRLELLAEAAALLA